MSDEQYPKIYLLPNLMTAGNLFCGFAATLKIVQGALLQSTQPDAASALFHAAIWFILGACVFDLLDGRLARLGGQDSPFGREFDSLADIVSFGLAPALMVYRIVLIDFPPAAGSVIAFVYLVCGALRLARFNCIAAAGSSGGRDKNFRGFPIPAAAGVIASLTLFMLWWTGERDHEIGRWKWVLPPLMVFLSFMMFSKFSYPSFKGVNWRTTRSVPAFPRDQPHPHPDGDELRVDAGGPLPRVSALRLPAALAFESLAARNRGRDRRGDPRRVGR